ncbi:MAG: thiamine phosphate synthase [Planctomycetaceae bacterium]|nr:thiamine phosphate synthase [Planctomycetaceae bacterium]MBP63299.1 thiamine phosphate synthase [Planctomycetaceae bacterium]
MPPASPLQSAAKLHQQQDLIPVDSDSQVVDTRVLRIVDANANRSLEGLRVIEEYLRFVLDDPHLTECCKQLRHNLADRLSVIPASQRFMARDIAGDVGREITTEQEQKRPLTESVLVASFQRVKQGLRCLEEYLKTLNAPNTPQLESLRYEVYELEKSVGITFHSQQRLSDARLYVLMDGGDNEQQLISLTQRLISADVDMIQLRDKRLEDGPLLERARLIRNLTAGSSTLFFVNDRPDIARLSGADGVHLGQSDMCLHDARKIVGTEGLIGISTHSLEQALQAVGDGANYVGVGPIFPSTTKNFDTFPGLELLNSVALQISLPVFAIGGIDQHNLPQVLGTGCSRVAVSGAVLQADDPDRMAQAFQLQLQA